MEIAKENCMDIIAEKYPDFKPIWDLYLSEKEIYNDEIFGITHEVKDTSLWGGNE